MRFVFKGLELSIFMPRSKLRTYKSMETTANRYTQIYRRSVRQADMRVTQEVFKDANVFWNVMCSLDISIAGKIGFIFSLEQYFLTFVQPWRGIVLSQTSVTFTYLKMVSNFPADRRTGSEQRVKSDSPVMITLSWKQRK
jgi:hypothetical protein